MSMSKRAHAENAADVTPVSIRKPVEPSATPPRGYLAEEFGQAITAARGATSQRAQARALGIAGPSYREVELGLANPTLARVEEMAEALGLTVHLKVSKARR